MRKLYFESKEEWKEHKASIKNLDPNKKRHHQTILYPYMRQADPTSYPCFGIEQVEVHMTEPNYLSYKFITLKDFEDAKRKRE